MCVVEAGTDGSRGNSEELGDLGWLVANEVAEDQDRPFIRLEPAEAAIELISVADGQELIRRCRAVDREDEQVRDPLALPAGFGNADIREQTVDPGVEPVRIAEARQVTPGDHQRFLQGVLGPVDIPEDPMCNREEAATAKANQVDERRLVALLSRLDEVAIHRQLPWLAPVGGAVHLYWSIVHRQRWKFPGSLRQAVATCGELGCKVAAMRGAG
jgi:hypothetical protein